MATYTIVSSPTRPLGPRDLHAGTPITVADGDIFIIEPPPDWDTDFDDGSLGDPGSDGGER